MFPIQKCPIPPNSLLATYAKDGHYVDCFCTEIAGRISFADFIFAFYTTTLFKLERWILTWLVSRPSTDEEARELAEAGRATFAAWSLEARRENEVLMCDLFGRTRSWLMIIPMDDSRTTLYFGSAVVPVRNPQTGKLSLGCIYRSLLGFHKIYSVLLLFSASRRLERRGSTVRSKR